MVFAILFFLFNNLFPLFPASPLHNLTGNPVTNLCHSNASKNIHNIMLLCYLRRNYNKQSKNTGENAVPAGNTFVSANADKAHPTYQAVDGGKQIGWLVD